MTEVLKFFFLANSIALSYFTLLSPPFVVFVFISFVTFRLVFGSVRFGYGSLVFFVVVRAARREGSEIHVVQLDFLSFFGVVFR